MNIQSDNNIPPQRHTLLLVVLLFSLVSCLYARTGGFEFVGLDDDRYVYENPQVSRGLSPKNIVWALTTFEAGNWHPLTWLSHMLDVSLFGMKPGWHHLISVLFHAASTSLLFIALYRMTGARWKSAFVAALFGIHPLHVESVAWVAERKDVLSGFFFMLVLLSYERYVRDPGARRYLLVALCLALGLMAKPMLVTVPFLLFLLDIWPLGRTPLAGPADGSGGTVVPWSRLLVEKAPLLGLTVASSVVTYVAQHQGGAMGLMDSNVFPLATRAGNAAVAYVRYIVNTFYPLSLSAFYPYPVRGLPAWQIAGSIIALFTLSLYASMRIRKLPFLFVGWLWFLGTLVPVIGLVQVGAQALADRYTYLPHVGLFLGLTWLVPALDESNTSFRRNFVSAALSIILIVSCVLTHRQIGFWRDSVALYTRALSVTPGIFLMHYNMGNALAQQRNYAEAVKHYNEALKIVPKNAETLNNIGNVMLSLRDYPGAISHYQQSLASQPNRPITHFNLGLALEHNGARAEAAEHYRKALQLQPYFPAASNRLRQLSR